MADTITTRLIRIESQQVEIMDRQKRLEHVIDRFLTRLLRNLGNVTERQDEMSVELDALTASVAGLTDAALSVETVLAALSKKIADLAAAGGTPAQFAELAQQIEFAKKRIADAVVANTPVAPVPSPAP